MQIKTNAGYLFDQLTSLIEKLTDEQYDQPLEIFSGATVGKHYRHIIEFFQCLTLSNDTQTICYDNRLRDRRMETDRMFVASLLNDLKTELAGIHADRNLFLVGDLSTQDEPETLSMGTTLLREFHYAVEHAIHHMAIIKMGIRQSFPEVVIPDEFGVAPSTLRYQHSVSAEH